VVWAWVHDAEDRLQSLSQRVESAVSPYAEKPGEERFTGHVTIARCKRISRSAAQTLAKFVEQAAARQFGAWNATEVELIQSELSSTGSRYTTVARFDLREAKG
jgi:2'-5' RNA ligase